MIHLPWGHQGQGIKPLHVIFIGEDNRSAAVGIAATGVLTANGETTAVWTRRVTPTRIRSFIIPSWNAYHLRRCTDASVTTHNNGAATYPDASHHPCAKCHTPHSPLAAIYRSAYRTFEPCELIYHGKSLFATFELRQVTCRPGSERGEADSRFSSTDTHH